jgi:two-component system, chemotaxis family, response regulator PixG
MLTPSSISSLKPLSTTNYAVVTITELSNQIQAYSQQRFTGQLELTINNTQDQKWSLYFCLGGLVWGTSKTHPMRSWYRHIYRHCPQLLVDREAKLPFIPDYDSLAALVKQGKIRPDQLEAVVEGQLMELLFDIVQWGEKLSKYYEGQLIYRVSTVDAIDSTLVVIPTVPVWQHALKLWEAWQRAGLENYSPNLAPVILKAEKLQELTSPIVYRNLITLADGSQTFRDLAVKMNQHLLVLTRPVSSWVRQGLIELAKVEDLSCSIETVTATTLESTTVTSSISQPKPINSERQSSSPLVACIDDSQIDSLTMNNILSQAGYQCINIQNSLEAIPMLLEHKPDLIFLDLVMPIANGYEICSQIRRILTLKDTPVIILTSSDGIVDRLRAKIVGATGFLTKPIDSEMVVNMLTMHLHKSTPLSSQKFQVVRASSLLTDEFSV